jgi:hypothetical protein
MMQTIGMKKHERNEKELSIKKQMMQNYELNKIYNKSLMQKY